MYFKDRQKSVFINNFGKNIAHHDEVTFANFLKYSYIIYQVKCIYFTFSDTLVWWQPQGQG